MFFEVFISDIHYRLEVKEIDRETKIFMCFESKVYEINNVEATEEKKKINGYTPILKMPKK